MMMMPYSGLKSILIICVISKNIAVGSYEGALEIGGLHGDLNQEDCSSGRDTFKKTQIDDCANNHDSCSKWESMGECDANPNYMLQNCMKSCNNCAAAKKLDAAQHTMSREEETYYLNTIKKYGVEQQANGSRKYETLFKIREAVLYMHNYVHAKNTTHSMSKHVIDSCVNKKELCAFWAVVGECDENSVYMITHCAPACQTCEKIDIKARCGDRGPNEKPSLQHGELNVMFERIVLMAPGNQTEESRLAALHGKVQADGTPYYTVNVHSRPVTEASPSNERTGAIPVDKLQDIKEDPWIITMDNFLTKDECDYLIDFGFKNGYERSLDFAGVRFDGNIDSTESKTRTSANSWCDEQSGCRNDPTVQRVMERMKNVTHISTDNFENLQMLKYEVGQFYRLHHDYIPHQKDRKCGPRILTFFLYLSDVEEAGGTGFTDLGITISPKQGRALLWPSVMNYDPSLKEDRTRHEALAVEKGTKFAANAWIHLYNHKDPHKLGCN